MSKKQEAAMKATIKYPAAGGEQYWRKNEQGQNTCRAVVIAEDGKEYGVKLTEGTPQWELPAGAELAIELRQNRSDGSTYAVLEGTPQAGNRGGGGGYPRKPALTPEQQAAEAQRLAPLVVSIYKHLDGMFHKYEDSLHKKPEAEDIRSMAISILISITDK
jgi:hypothetical protein